MIYILVLPVLEELATVIVQALEILKGKAMVVAQRVQNELLELSPTENEEKQMTHVIGFQLPEEPEEYEDDEEDWDEDE